MKHGEYPDDSHIDLESVVLHELGHMAGNRHHQPPLHKLADGRGNRDRRVVAHPSGLVA